VVMFRLIFIIIITLYVSGSKAQSDLIAKSDSTQYQSHLVLRNGGYKIFDISFTRLWIKGIINVTDSGVKFIPDTLFESNGHRKVFRYNHLVKEFFIPYSKIERIKKSTYVECFFPITNPVIITKEGVKYRMYIDRYKTFKKQTQNRSHQEF
jgi:hypothetical protein